MQVLKNIKQINRFWAIGHFGKNARFLQLVKINLGILEGQFFFIGMNKNWTIKTIIHNYVRSK